MRPFRIDDLRDLAEYRRTGYNRRVHEAALDSLDQLPRPSRASGSRPRHARRAQLLTNFALHWPTGTAVTSTWLYYDGLADIRTFFATVAVRS